MQHKVCVLVPCYRRPEYTRKCIEALEQAQDYPGVLFNLIDDGSNDETSSILNNAKLPKIVDIYEDNRGLRSTIIGFLEKMKGYNAIDFIAKMDNDCIVPKNWLNDLVAVFDRSDADILSPNVFPSDAAHRDGRPDIQGKGYMASKTVGGLWIMKRALIEGIDFEQFEVSGLTGAFNLLDQIVVEKEPKVGWVPSVICQDLGHWSGGHPQNIKTPEHKQYYQEVGRRIAWA